MESLIGLYKKDVNYNDLRVGTPDPTKYHDISTVNLELNNTPLATRVGHNHGFSGLRGVVIPRATRDGGSRGYDHMIPRPAYIDPELTNRRLIVDPMKIRDNPEAMAAAIREAYSNYPDPADATIAAFAQFAEQQENSMPSEISIPQPQTVVPTPLATPVGHSSNTYVVPKALPGGGQAKTASFSIPPQPGFGAGTSLPQPTLPPSMPVQHQASAPQPQRTSQRSLQAIRSLRGEFSDQPSQSGNQAGSHPTRKVTFELPSMGQFPCFFHGVVRSDSCLVLIYDHSHPAQHVWFPPALEDPVTKEPTAVAVMVDGTAQEPPMLYLAYSTGIRFTYRNEEYCILTVEKEKRLDVQDRGQ